MTSYLHQSVARQQIAELIATAQQGHVRRQFVGARRAARTASRNERLARRRDAGADNAGQNWAHQIGYA